MTSVLLVDDEARFRQVLFKRLTRRGFHVLEADTGTSALEILSKTPCEVVILDVQLSEVHGLDVLRSIKNLYPDTSVILLSDNTREEDGIKGMQAGAYDYLTKPIDFEELAKVIQFAREHHNDTNLLS